MTAQNFDFSIVDSVEDWKAKRNDLQERMGKADKEFAQFVRTSVHFFYREGNKQIGIINSLLRMAYFTPGYNIARLKKYLEQVVPHKMQHGTPKRNGMRQGNNKGSLPPSFGKKIDTFTSYENFYESKVIRFMSDNPDWAKYNPDRKEITITLDKLDKKVMSDLKKLGMTLPEYFNHLQQVMIQEAIKQGSKVA